MGGDGKGSTAFAMRSLEQQGAHTIEISTSGSPDKNSRKCQRLG